MPSPTDAPIPAPPEVRCAIWNPDAAASWSLVFTPAFGAFIHMLNWHALGQPDKAASARRWFYASLGLLAVQLLASALNARLNSESGLMHTLGLLFLLIWYFAAARPQARLVRTRFGSHYPRRTWDQPLLGAVLAGTAYASAGAVLTLLLVALT
jgi:hypothetical protein